MGGRDDISWEDIKRLIAELAASSQLTARSIAELREQSKETDRRMQETDRRMQETDRRMQETDRRMQETDRRLRELARKIEGIGDKFGYFAEGMALPTMERILRTRFKMENVAPRLRVRKGHREQEYDVLAWANGQVNTVIIVEVKSRVKREAVAQLIAQLEGLPQVLPEFAGKKRIGILAGVDWDKDVETEAQEAGLYTARIHDEIFTLTTPKGFRPKVW